MMKISRTLTLFAALGTTTALTAPALAANVAVLTGDRDLVWVDTEAMAASGTTAVEGATGRLLGIDVRPANGMLYGVFEDGTIATIDAKSGMASPVSTLSTMLPPGVTATVDFNPVADRLRVMGSDGTSLRVNVETGEVTTDGRHAYAEGGMTPDVIAGAYTNAFAGTESTQLFNIDRAGWLVLQDPPNDGVLNPVGELGIPTGEMGLDIVSDGAGANEAWLMSGGALFAVDLATGKAREVGAVEGVSNARDLAVMPAM